LFLKPFLYLFLLIAWINIGTVAAQDLLTADSLPVSAIADTLITQTFPGDSIRMMDSAMFAPKKEPVFKSRIKYSATDSIILKIQDQRAYMFRQTQVNYEDIELKAYKTEFDFTSKIVYAVGGRDSLNHYLEAPIFKTGNDEYETDSISYNFESKKGVIHRIKTKQGEGFLYSVKAKRYDDGHIDLGGGIYTTCDHADHPHFGLRLKEGKVIPGDKVIFRYAYLELLDIPFYFLALPFGFFPQNNKQAVSGILPPTIGGEISRGVNLTNGGYYFAFSDHFDAQIMGDIYSSGTWRSTLTTRYMKRYKFTGDLNLSYGVSVSGDKGLDLSKQKQYSIKWSHRQDAKANPNQTFSASIDYSSSSYDKQFNYDNQKAVFNNTKRSNIQFSRKWPNTPFSLSTGMSANQTSTNGNVTIDFPNFNFRMERIYPFRKKESVGKPKWYEDIALQYDATMQNTLSGHEDNLFSDKNLQNMKNGFQHRIPFSINFKALKFFNITPSMNYTGVMYTSQIRKHFERNQIDSTLTKGVLVTDTIRGLSYAHTLSPSLSISMTPKFYLTNRYDHKPNSKIIAIRTMISPTASVNYTPDMSRYFDYYKEYVDGNGKLQEYSIYAGQGAYSPPSPSRRQSGSINLGVNGNVEMKVRGNDSTSNEQARKVKLLNNISANTSYNIFADSLNWSPVSLSANTTIFGLNLQASGGVDPYKLNPAGTGKINQFGPRLTGVSFNTGISLPLNKKEAKKDEKKEKDNPYSYFDIPWSVNLNYGISYSKQLLKGNTTQTLSFSGNVSFTKNWALTFSSSYDFQAKKIAQATMNITRDLHCWQMSMGFSPFGAYKYYNFKINVKSSTLQDLKYEKKKSQSDFSRTTW